MAEVLKLTRAGASDLNILGGTDGIELKNQNAWVQRSHTPVYGRQPALVTESITVYVKDDSNDELSTILQDIAEYERYVAQYRTDRTVEIPVYLYDQMVYETNPRRAYVDALRFDQTGSHHDPESNDSYIEGVLSLLRGPWESPTARDLPQATPAALRFDSGSTEFTAGETITGATTADTAVVAWWILESGTWGVGDAAGIVYLYDSDGDFQNNEDLNGSSGGANMATADGTRVGSPALLYDYTAAGSAVAAHDIVGDIDARVDVFETIARGAPGAGIDQLWMGVRSVNKYGADRLNNLVFLWEVEKGVAGTDTGFIADATASPGGSGNTKARVLNGGTATWAKRVSIPLDNLTNNENDQVGRFLFIARAQVTAGKWNIQLRQARSTQPAAVIASGDIVEVEKTTWTMHECGIFTFPRTSERFNLDPFTGNPQRYETIDIWAEQTSGAGNLEIDCLTLIPVDESFFTAKDIDISTAAILALGTNPSGERFVFIDTVTGTSQPYATGRLDLPPGDGRIIYTFSAKNAANYLGDFLDLNTDDEGKYLERWRLLRGAE